MAEAFGGCNPQSFGSSACMLFIFPSTTHNVKITASSPGNGYGGRYEKKTDTLYHLQNRPERFFSFYPGLYGGYEFNVGNISPTGIVQLATYNSGASDYSSCTEIVNLTENNDIIAEITFTAYASAKLPYDLSISNMKTVFGFM